MGEEGQGEDSRNGYINTRRSTEFNMYYSMRKGQNKEQKETEDEEQT